MQVSALSVPLAQPVDREGVPYATRILIRRPQSPRRFSGNVHVETSHPQYGFNVVWSQTFDYLLANGDAYVSITTRARRMVRPTASAGLPRCRG